MCDLAAPRSARINVTDREIAVVELNATAEIEKERL